MATAPFSDTPGRGSHSDHHKLRAAGASGL